MRMQHLGASARLQHRCTAYEGSEMRVTDIFIDELLQQAHTHVIRHLARTCCIAHIVLKAGHVDGRERFPADCQLC